MLGFALTASMVGSGEKLGTDQRIGQPACCGLCQELFFSGAVSLLNSVDDYVKGCHVRRLLAESVHGLTWEATLGYEWGLFVAVIK
jgi:hypothetical protein